MGSAFGNTQKKRLPLFEFAFDAERRVVTFEYVFDDGEPESGAAARARTRQIDAIKPFGDSIQVLRAGLPCRDPRLRTADRPSVENHRTWMSPPSGL